MVQSCQLTSGLGLVPPSMRDSDGREAHLNQTRNNPIQDLSVHWVYGSVFVLVSPMNIPDMASAGFLRGESGGTFQAFYMAATKQLAIVMLLQSMIL